MLGRKFGIVVCSSIGSTGSWTCASNGSLSARAVATELMGVSFDDVGNALNDPGKVFELFEIAARQAIRRGARPSSRDSST